MVNYNIGDSLIRMKNAAMANKSEFVLQKTGLVERLTETLIEMGYLDKVTKEGNKLIAKLAYKHKQPVLTDVILISTPGLRVYESYAEISKRRGPFRLIVSTSKGIISSSKAVKMRLGGEIIAKLS